MNGLFDMRRNSPIGVKSLLISFALTFLVTAANAQLTATLTVNPRPDPYLANWAQRRSTATIRVQNNGASVQGKFKVEVSKDGDIVARTKTENMQVLTFPTGTSTWNAEDM